MAILSITLVSSLLSQNYASAMDMPSTIPSWFHYKAILWANGQMSDQDFLNAIQELTSGQSMSNSPSSNGMQGMGGMSGTSSTTDNLLASIGQLIYCNDVQGMTYSPQAMAAMENCNAVMPSMSGMSGGTSSSNSMAGIPASSSNCVNTQSLPGQSSQCSVAPSFFDEIAGNMVGISSMFTFDAYTQGLTNGMAGMTNNPLFTAASLQSLAGVLSSGTLNAADYDKYFTTPTRDINQISVDVDRHTSNCNSENFPEVDWEFCNKAGDDLNHAHLSKSNLIGADLAGANLYKSDLVEANLDFANLTNTQMENIDLSSASMSGTYLAGANVKSSDFNFVTMNGANMTGATLQDSTMRWATLERDSFNGANLNGVLFMNSDLRGSDFRGASLQGTGFAYADLTGANFDGDDLKGVDLGGATLTGASLHCINNPVCK
ncbi:MAG TPA: pentapeptide repeat-containing protein [Candidatus Nitrosotalea sp.]|nr:pentapeptide repeat-containing protein [Candidatus Nitrosotalea sp.]